MAIAMAPIMVRWSETGPTATAFWRLALAFPFFWVQWSRRPGRRPERVPQKTSLRDAAVLTIPGLFFAADLAFWHWSIGLTTIANATLFANLAAVLVSITAWIWLRERYGWPFVLGLALAIVGVTFLVGASFDLGRDKVIGDLLGLLTAVFYAGYQLAVKKARARFTTARIMVWSIPTACIVLTLLAVVSGERFAAVTPTGWLVLLALAVISQVAGQGLIVQALAHLPSSFASVSLLVQPVAAGMFAWLLLGENLGTMQIGGGVLVLIGIYLARRGSRSTDR